MLLLPLVPLRTILRSIFADAAPGARVKLQAGDLLEDRYEVQGFLDSGGMADVYRVLDRKFGKVMALKVLREEFWHVNERFHQEGRLQAKLEHPNILLVTDTVTIRGAAGLVMAFADGPNLQSWLLNRGWLTTGHAREQEAERIFRGIVQGVRHAHEQRVVHRDLKPANVLLHRQGGELVPKVADFGLAKIIDGPGGVPMNTRPAMGTPAYMAPEQLRGDPDIDGRADVFALGCVLYELLGQGSPFHRGDTFTTLLAITQGDYVPLDHAIPLRLRQVVDGCLQVDRERRLGSCEEILGLLSGELPRAMHLTLVSGAPSPSATWPSGARDFSTVPVATPAPPLPSKAWRRVVAGLLLATLPLAALLLFLFPAPVDPPPPLSDAPVVSDTGVSETIYEAPPPEPGDVPASPTAPVPAEGTAATRLPPTPAEVAARVRPGLRKCAENGVSGKATFLLSPTGETSKADFEVSADFIRRWKFGSCARKVLREVTFLPFAGEPMQVSVRFGKS